MELSDIYGYGQLFGFSGMDGDTYAWDDFVGMLQKRPITIRMELSKPLSVYIPVSDNVKFCAVMSDFLQADDCGKRVDVTWADANTIIGRSEIPVRIIADDYEHAYSDGITVYQSDAKIVAFSQSGDRFAVVYGHETSNVCRKVRDALKADIDSVLRKRVDFYGKVPACNDKRYEKLYYKALSINKVNVYSAAGNIPVRYTTPDRVPHKHMWLWDSVFHSLAFVSYDQTLAKDSILAVLTQQKESGFIPHMMSCGEYPDALTQPPLLSYGVWQVYKASRDIDFLRKCADKLDKYLRWDMTYRDINGNSLLEWLIESDENCRSGESGMDNSPRFDKALTLDAVDFSAFFANDAECLSRIYSELGQTEKSVEWKKTSQKVGAAVNGFLWCEEDGIYYDRNMDGTFSKIAAISSFAPLFAGIATKEQAAALVEKLTDENKFRTEMPFSSLSKDNNAFCQDMWRGSAWLNYNYMIICGLNKYGYCELAEEIRRKTLECVNAIYLKTGTIFEFYDSENKRIPYVLDRKGPCPLDPDWRIKVHSITDYNWSACFTILMIQSILY